MELLVKLLHLVRLLIML